VENPRRIKKCDDDGYHTQQRAAPFFGGDFVVLEKLYIKLGGVKAVG
jgi:hypothetical protein